MKTSKKTPCSTQGIFLRDIAMLAERNKTFCRLSSFTANSQDFLFQSAWRLATNA